MYCIYVSKENVAICKHKSLYAILFSMAIFHSIDAWFVVVAVLSMVSSALLLLLLNNQVLRWKHSVCVQQSINWALLYNNQYRVGAGCIWSKTTNYHIDRNSLGNQLWTQWTQCDQWPIVKRFLIGLTNSRSEWLTMNISRCNSSTSSIYSLLSTEHTLAQWDNHNWILQSI